MKEVFFLRAIIPLAALATTVLPARASTVVFTATGTITNVYEASAFDASVVPGAPFSATFQVDSNAHDINAGMPNDWSYSDTNPLHEAYVQFGSYSLRPDPASIALNSLSGTISPTLDAYRLESYNSIGSGLTAGYATSILQDTTNTALTAKGLPPMGPGVNDIAPWNVRLFIFRGTNSASGIGGEWRGEIDYIRTDVIPGSAIPEPGSLALLSTTGLPVLGFALRRRRA